MTEVKRSEILELLETQSLGKHWFSDYITEQIIYTLDLVRKTFCPFIPGYLYIQKTLTQRSDLCIMHSISQMKKYYSSTNHDELAELTRTIYHELYDAIRDGCVKEDVGDAFTNQEISCYFAYITISLRTLNYTIDRKSVDFSEMEEWYKLFVECYSEYNLKRKYFPNIGSSHFFPRLEIMIRIEMNQILTQNFDALPG